MSIMKEPIVTNNAFDLQEGYYSCLLQQLLEHGMQRVDIDKALRLGKVAGDLMKVALDALNLPVDILICGPARWLGLCGQGGPSSGNPAAAAELSDALTSSEGGEGGGGDWVGPAPIEPSKGPEGPGTV